MPEKRTPRRYEAPVRRAKAEATRMQVMTAARRLFVDRGIAGTTVASIASEAGVSAQTVYALYRSKPGLLLALLDQLERSVDAPGFAAAIDAAPTALGQLRLIVEFHCELFEHGLDVVEVVRRTSSHPEVRPFWEEGQRRRREACERWVKGWDDSDQLRPGIDARTAADLLWLLCGDDVYAGLVLGCRWDRGRVEQWLVESLHSQLLTGGNRTPRSRRRPDQAMPASPKARNPDG